MFRGNQNFYSNTIGTCPEFSRVHFCDESINELQAFYNHRLEKYIIRGYYPETIEIKSEFRPRESLYDDDDQTNEEMFFMVGKDFCLVDR